MNQPAVVSQAAKMGRSKKRYFEFRPSKGAILYADTDGSERKLLGTIVITPQTLVVIDNAEIQIANADRTWKLAAEEPAVCDVPCVLCPCAAARPVPIPTRLCRVFCFFFARKPPTPLDMLAVFPRLHFEGK
jgi:hypothetical protein